MNTTTNAVAVPAERAHEPLVQKWLTMLGQVSGKTTTTAQAEADVRLYAPMLAAAFPAQAFTQTSFRAVAADCPHWPSYGQLHKLLTAWFRDNRAGGGARESLGDHGLEGMDAHWLAYWWKRRPEVAEQDIQVRAIGRWRDEAQLPLARLASRIRSQSPKAWAHITGGYAPRPQPLTDEQHDEVRRKADALREELRMPAPPGRSARVQTQLSGLGGNRSAEAPKFGGPLEGEALALARQQQLGKRAPR